MARPSIYLYSVYDIKTGKTYQGTSTYFKDSKEVEFIRKEIRDKSNYETTGEWLNSVAFKDRTIFAFNRYVVVKDSLKDKNITNYNMFKKWAKKGDRVFAHLYRNNQSYGKRHTVQILWGLEHLLSVLTNEKEKREAKDQYKREEVFGPNHNESDYFTVTYKNKKMLARFHVPRNKKWKEQLKFVENSSYPTKSAILEKKKAIMRSVLSSKISKKNPISFKETESADNDLIPLNKKKGSKNKKSLIQLVNEKGKEGLGMLGKVMRKKQK